MNAHASMPAYVEGPSLHLRPLTRPHVTAISRHSTPEAALVQAIREGSERAFRELVEQYEADITATVVGMLGPSADVDDVVQEVFIRFHQSIDRFREDASVRTFLKRIAINRSLDVLRRRKRTWARIVRHDESGLANEPGLDADSPSWKTEQRERDQQVHAAIQALSPAYRAVVILRLVEGYSTEETARMLDVKYGTVLSRLSRAQAKLRQQLSSLL